MKKTILTVAAAIFLSVQTGQSQISDFATMEFNNAKYNITNSGVLFNDPVFFLGGYFVPKDQMISVINAAHFWFGGQNSNQQLSLAGVNPITQEVDFQPGPYSENHSYQTSEYTQKYGTSIWRVTQEEIDLHMQSWANPGYVVPDAILSWPGNGDTILGVNELLAPFADLNNNDIYEPELGEYPQIKGCEALYMIINEHKIHEATQTGPLGIEMHYLFYQFTSPSIDALNNTTFLDLSIYNRSSLSWDQFRTGLYFDGDLGNPFDDYTGCDTTRNLVYLYNGDNIDENHSGMNGFGENPPAFGVLSLEKPLHSFISYSGASFPQGLPNVAFHMWNNLNGRWSDGTQVLDNNNDPTNFMYHENPSLPNSYSEAGMGNTPSDKHALISFGNMGSVNNSEQLAPYGKTSLSLAFIYNRTGNHLQNVDGLSLVADSIQNFYNNAVFSCADVTLGMMDKKELSQLSVYPNPAVETVTIQSDNFLSGEIIVTSISGTSVMNIPVNNADKVIVSTENLSEGVYFIQVQSSDNTHYKRTKLIVLK